MLEALQERFVPYMTFVMTAVVLVVVPYAVMQSSERSDVAADPESVWVTDVADTIEACGTVIGDFRACVTRERIQSFGLSIPDGHWGTGPGKVTVTGVADDAFIVEATSEATPHITYTVVRRSDGYATSCAPVMEGRCSG